MGHRAFRTGDLVAPLVRLTSLELWAQPVDNVDSSDITVHDFRLGLLLCIQEFTWKLGTKELKALVFDNRSMKHGWIGARFLRRID